MSKRAFDVTKLLAWVTALISGLQTAGLGGLTEVLVAGTVYKVADLITALQKIQATLQAVPTAEAQLAAAVQAVNDQGATMEKFLRQTRKSVKAQLGSKSASLPQYGIDPDKDRTPLTTQQKVTQVERSAATREARHTMGKNQKNVSDFRILFPGVDLPRIPLQVVA